MKNKNLVIAVVITLLFACTVLLLFHPSRSPLGSFFDVFTILIVTHYIAIAIGVVVLLLRIMKIIRNNSMLIYVLVGTLNVFLAITGITLFVADHADMEWLHKCLGNLLVGFIILCDSFFFPEQIKQ